MNSINFFTLFCKKQNPKPQTSKPRMYKLIIRPILFCFSAETIHHFVSISLRIAFAIPGMAFLVRKVMVVKHPLLEQNLFGLHFPNPVGIAAGFDKEANLYNHLANFGFGHIETGTITPLPQPGNPKPRLFRIIKDGAIINRMGFNNHGADAFLKNLRKHKPNVIIGGNIGKNTLTPEEKAIDDYIFCFDKIHSKVDYFAINVSCPNIANLHKLADHDNLQKLLQAIQSENKKKNIQKPVLLKISPDLTNQQLDEVIEIVKSTGIDGIIATNTTTKREGLSISQNEVQAIGNGGLSGKPLKERSTEVIRYIVEKSQNTIPVIGVGGIFTAQDAIEKINAGAKLVQVYTGFIYEGPFIARKINKAILKQRLQDKR